MSYNVDFCTCNDFSCPNHPTNNEMGCTLCIAKNLEEGEIPTCFFKAVDPDYDGFAYFYADFAKLVEGKNGNNRSK